MEALRVVKNTLEKKQPTDNLQSNMDIVRLLALVLRYNNFEFNEKHYLQINGVAMGTKWALKYLATWNHRTHEVPPLSQH